jgi:hypothetical protein
MNVKKNIAISDTGFIFNPLSGDSFSVNPIGLEILKLLKEGKAKEEIIKVLKNDYMVDEYTLEKDLYDFNIMLENYKLTE